MPPLKAALSLLFVQHVDLALKAKSIIGDPCVLNVSGRRSSENKPPSFPHPGSCFCERMPDFVDGFVVAG